WSQTISVMAAHTTPKLPVVIHSRAMKPTGLALVAALAAGGCPPRSTPPTVAPALGLTADVTGAIEQWRQAYEVRSMDALARLYSRDPSLAIVQDGTRQLGWAAIEPALRGVLGR